MTTDSKQDEARETLCANCGDKLYQTANPNNLHWYHAASGDVRCPTRFAQPSARSVDEHPPRVWVKLLSDGSLAAYKTDIRKEHFDGRPVYEYVRASLAAVEGDEQSVNVRSECCNAEVRHRYCAKCGQECRIVSFPSLADAIAIVENCEYENVAVDVILQRLKALSVSER